MIAIRRLELPGMANINTANTEKNLEGSLTQTY